MMFLERLSSSGMKDNYYWYDKNYSPATQNDLRLPNCTTYCLGEIGEVLGLTEPPKLFNGRSAGGFPTAKNWYNDWLGKKGIEPKIGGIAVWGTPNVEYGHVAFVLDYEDVGDEGAKIKVCQSNYKGTYFEVREYIVKQGRTTAGVGYPYIGCCYNDIDDKRVKRNKDLLQVDVIADKIRVRKTPNGEAYAGRYCPKGLYNVYDMVDAGGYRWLKLDDACWIARNDDDGWTKLYEKESDFTVQELQTRLDALASRYNELQALYNAKLEENGQLNVNLISVSERLNSALAENKLVASELENSRKNIEDAIDVLRR